MSPSTTLYLGIELTGKRKGFSCAILDRALHILFMGVLSPLEWQGMLGESNELLVAVDSSLSMNGGFMASDEYRAALGVKGKSRRITEMRVCEYILSSHSLVCTKTPQNVAKYPASVQKSLKFASELGMAGFQFWPSIGASRQMLETHADGCYWSMLGVKPFAVTSLEGRIQRQLALQARGLAVPDAMKFFEEITRHRLLTGKLPEEAILSTSKLNTLVAAYTAWVAGNRPGEYSCIGEAEEGILVLPAARLPEPDLEPQQLSLVS